MKRIFAVLAAFIITDVSVRCHTVCAVAQPEVSAKAAVLISADTGEVVYAKNCNEKLPMASTTKIMTTLLCLESGGLYDKFVVDSEAIKVEGSSMGLQEGDIVTKYDLCCGMLLPSGNDAANAAAVRISGNIGKFAELMNDRARKLGLSKTYFVTPSGLEGEGHGSSAYDMAMLAREALRNELFRSICSQDSIKLEFGDPPYVRWLKNTNKLLNMYDGVYGVKTGFTDEAGRCLVSACERDGKDLICVTLNDRSDWNDHIAMYDYGFDTVRVIDAAIPAGMTVNTVGGEVDKLRLVPKESSVRVCTMAGNEEDIQFTLLTAPFVYAPINYGNEAAMLRISFMGREVETVPLYAAESITAAAERPEKKGIFTKFKEMLGSFFSR
ncbi:D-alanyl-D-alanine carboxypeptidase family protein [Ruminococcus flavefaciens]|uniref:D-alanyl-D-alanine carboxypeptidase (Penicillin-binding protein 5/6) n=1 Tax=Ruminococcus flavefaciens TaxID=1265 RepID=A0A1M7I2K6_RUMFL|nr:D-alanyl-D-alanine carboxypeptidase family protein [Ruminococcus flavefaciens]SHM34783.1 D-alanyl-D-alanine carboxypeptidase (penicillin-binding protein 5/6) [Ruminococcus flavefaciens]